MEENPKQKGKAMTAELIPTEENLAKAGFTAAADGIKRKRDMMRKLRIAFEHFRVVKPEHISRFNEELRKRTEVVTGSNIWGDIRQYDALLFTPIVEYGTVPPQRVIGDLINAQDLGCFDRFEVCTIQSVRVIPDPIVFGIIEGCDNKYFITQWDNDVSIEDILSPEEG